MTTRLKILVAFQVGQTLYTVLVNSVTGEFWNTDTEAWETYNSANWADYAIALTELTGSGLYMATFPAAITDDALTVAGYFQQAGGSPTLGDTPAAGLNASQGVNLAAVAGDGAVADKLQQNLTAVAKGAAAGVPTASVIPTDMENTQSNAYAGRSVVFTSGVAFECAGRIVSYNPTNGVITLAAPLPVAPEADDTFVIV